MPNDTYYVFEGQEIPLEVISNKKNLINGTQFTRDTNWKALERHHEEFVVTRGYGTDLLLEVEQETFFNEFIERKEVGHLRNIYTDPNNIELVLGDEIIIKFNGDTKYFQDIIHEYNCEIIDKYIDLENVFVLKCNNLEPHATLSVANQLSREKNVVYSEPNFIQESQTFSHPPNDLFDLQWYLHNSGQFQGKEGIDINILEAWAMTDFGNPEIVIAVHDKGVDIGHQDLKSNIVTGWDFDFGDSNPSSKKFPHGTACAGITSASIKKKGIIGIAPKCKLLPIKIAKKAPWDVWIKSMKYASKRADVISCSWSISPNNSFSETIKKIVREMKVPCVFAVGNDEKSTVRYPASLDDTIGVGACTNLGARAKYSNYGEGLDIIAPSDGGKASIASTDIRGIYGYNPNGDYCHPDDETGFTGTSAAAPQVAGVIALMLGKNPNLSTRQIKTIFQSTSTKIGNPSSYTNGYSTEYGYGLINAAEALREIKEIA